MDEDRVTVGQGHAQVQPEVENTDTDSGMRLAPESPMQSVQSEAPQPDGPEGNGQADQAPEERASGVPTDATPRSSDAREEPVEAGPQSIEDLKPGMQLKGKVRNIVDFGAFVDVGVGRDGLAHISTLKRAGIDKDLKVGDEIDVVIRRVDLDNNRISLTVPRAERAVKSALRELEVGSVVTGRVKRLVSFGAFVDIGAPTDGLLHVSQLSGGFVSHPSEALEVGEEVQVRILDVDPERRRISLTLKDVEPEQSTAPAPEEPEEQGPQNGAPTAFEIAFRQALAERRRRHRGA